MKHSNIDFRMISEALSYSIEVIQEEQPSDSALLKLKEAQKDLQHALSFSLSHNNGL